MKTTLAIIGGTGLTTLNGLEITRREVVNTPYGEPSGPLIYGQLCSREVVFLPRHGHSHTIPPHRVNYRANIWALHHIGVEKVMAVAAVGGIHPELMSRKIAIPDQIIDYTGARANTFFEDDLSHVVHVDFTTPYCEELRTILIQAAAKAEVSAMTYGVYGATQGPRLETAAEINRLARDGCDMVGMTGMPEAVLARELGLCYAACAVVANAAAGRGVGAITMAEIEANLESGMAEVRALLEQAIRLL